MSPAAPPTPVGTRLRQAREARGLSLLQAAHALHIKPHYLEALERDDWDALPSPAHARGFLRTYAAFLGLNPDALLRPAPGEAPGPATVPPTQQPTGPDHDALPPEAQAIFRQLGQTLRQQREALGLSLDDAEALTRVKAHYLRALEEGRVDALPSPVQGRGMLLHYARALHLDPEPLLLAFAEGLQARLQARERPRAARWWWRLQVQHWGNLLLAGLALGAVALFLLWSALQVLQVYASQAQTPTVAALGVVLRTPTRAAATALVTISAPSPAPGTATTATPAPPPVDAGAEVVASPPATPAAETPPPEPVTAPVHVVVQVRHRAWLRVLSDGQEVFRARVAPGERFTFRAEARLEVQTGDAAALQLVYNQQDLGVLGRLGEPLVLIFTPEQMLTPTPLASPTPTITPTPTATPTGPTPTPQGSPTPSPTATPVLQPRP